MKVEESSPSLQYCVLKDVSNRKDLTGRPSGWRRRLLVGGHHDNDEGFQSAGSLFSSAGSQENSSSNGSGSCIKSSTAATSVSWDDHSGAGASGCTSSSEDGFLCSLDDSFQEHEPHLPGPIAKLLHSPLYQASQTLLANELKENVLNPCENSPACGSSEESADASQSELLGTPLTALLNPYMAFKRPVSPGNQPFSPSHKRYRGYQLQRFTSYSEPSCSSRVANFSRSLSDTDASIKLALQKSDADPDLIGDFTKPYALPLVKGKHHDLKMILPSTLADVLQGKYLSVVDEVTIIDCRYPFEYEGGHIKGAINVFSSEDLLSEFLEKAAPTPDSRRVLVFHCEFSSERGPKLSRLLREKDRQINEYPALKHPEIYVLEGGYKAFYEEYQEWCTPQGYIPMRHKGHETDLRRYRSMAKTEAASSKSRAALHIRALKKF
ncbi:M-phase inducer phosphatase 1-B-like isoform X2 [Amblyomma americanum]